MNHRQLDDLERVLNERVLNARRTQPQATHVRTEADRRAYAERQRDLREMGIETTGLDADGGPLFELEEEVPYREPYWPEKLRRNHVGGSR